MNIYWVPGVSAGGFVAAHLDDCSPIFCPLHLHFWDWSERQWYWKLANKSKEGKGLFEQCCQLMHVFLCRIKPPGFSTTSCISEKGDDQAKWLNPTCQVQAMISQGLIMLAGTSFHRVVEGIPGHLLTYTHGPYFTGVRLCSSINKHGRNSKMECTSWKEEKLMTRERPFAFVLHACLTLCCWRGCFVCRESELQNCQSWFEQGGESWRTT